MIVKRLLQLNLFVSIIIAIAFLLAPKLTLALYGVTGDDILYAIAQYFGTTHVAFAILLWIALRTNEPQLLRTIVVSFFAGDLAGSLVLFIAQVRGLMNTSGWALVGLTLLFAFGYGYGALKRLPES
jgi:predicted ferric reductase